MTVLLTGFEPFDGHPVNASWLAVQAVARAWRGSDLLTVELPVSFGRAPQVLWDRLQAVLPDVVVCVGEAAGRSHVGIERVAVNIADAELADNDGARPVDAPVVLGGPVGYLTGLPLRACLAAAKGTGVPTEISDTAGTYVCNATFYALMDALTGMPGVRGGFVHVPRTPDQAGGGPAMTSADAALALAAVVAAAGRPAKVG